MPRPNIALIIQTIDEHLEKTGKPTIIAVDAAEILDRKGILKDSTTRRGKPLRDILRANGIPHAYQIGVYWHIPHSGAGKKKL